MWTRSELKAKAKVAFKANFWKSVFIAAILAFFVNAASMGSGAAGSSAGAGAGSRPHGGGRCHGGLPSRRRDIPVLQ